MANEWADREAQKRSYELFARYVAPHFSDAARAPYRSMEWARENRPTFIGRVGEAIVKSMSDHAAEQQEKSGDKP
jgi:limonene 1,2-monooxygenase